MVRIIVPIILLALALSAWYLEIQTKPESAAQANTVQPPPQGTSTTSTTTPTGSAQGEEASNAGPSGTVIPLDLPQSTGSEVIQLASQLESSISSLAPSTKSCLVVRERNSDSDQLLLSNLFEHNPQLSLVPASNQKLITAAAALFLLGPDYRFTTRVLAAQSPENGVIAGDLYLVGGGDPLLYTDDYLDTFLRSPAVYTPIEELAQQLYDLGLRRVVGRIVGVESRYDDERKAAQAASFYFIGPLSALLINDGYENYQARRDLGIEPIPATDPAQFSAALFDDLLEDLGVVITSRPRSATASDDIGGFIQLASLESAPLSELLDSLLTDSDNTSAELLLKEIASYQNYLQSRVGVDDLGAAELEEAASFGDAAGFGKAGLPVSASGDSPAFGAPQISDLGSNQTDTTTSPPQDTAQPEDGATSPPQDTAQPEDGPTITAPAFLATTTTEPEPDLTPTTEPESDFTTTEPERVIPAIEDPDENPLNILPGSTALGVQYVGEILIENGIQSWVGTPRDGSGLDRGNLLSCKVVADVLDYFGPDSDFASSLAVAGRTGTLQNSFLDTPLEGRLIGKTGSLPGVFALSGFIGSESESAKTVTFSFIVNFDQDETTEESIGAVRQDILFGGGGLSGYDSLKAQLRAPPTNLELMNSSDSQDSSQSSSDSFSFKNLFSGGQDSPFAALRTTKIGEELAILLREYLKQQTIRPFKDLFRWLLWGLAGALLILSGVAMLALAGLRALQNETGSSFTGSLSWLPYLISSGGLLILILLAFLAMNRQPSGLPKDQRDSQKN